MLEQKEDLIVSIGRIAGSFKTSGEVRVQILTDFPERFDELSSVILSKDGEREDFCALVQGVRYHKSFAILKLDRASSPEEAKKLAGYFICIKKDELSSLPEGSFYLFELEGLSVYSQDGSYIGKVKEVYKLPAQDILVVKRGEEEILIPLLKEFISEISREEKRIVAVPHEGLF